MDEATFAHLIAKARQTNGRRDASDHAFGFVAPGDDGPWNHLRTATVVI
jgi:hypothetical protein